MINCRDYRNELATKFNKLAIWKLNTYEKKPKT